MFRVRKRTGIPRSSTWTLITTPKSPGLIRTAKNFTPTQITTWAAIRSFMAPRCSGCAKKISVSYDTTAESLRRGRSRSEEHTSELQSPCNLVCRLLLEKKKKKKNYIDSHI